MSTRTLFEKGFCSWCGPANALLCGVGIGPSGVRDIIVSFLSTLIQALPALGALPALIVFMLVFLFSCPSADVLVFTVVFLVLMIL